MITCKFVMARFDVYWLGPPQPVQIYPCFETAVASILSATNRVVISFSSKLGPTVAPFPSCFASGWYKRPKCQVASLVSSSQPMMVASRSRDVIRAISFGNGSFRNSPKVLLI